MDTKDLFCKPVPAIKVLQYYYLAILQQSLWTLWICSANLFQPLKFYNITTWQFCNNLYGHYGFVLQTCSSHKSSTVLLFGNFATISMDTMDLFCKPVPAIKVLLYYYLAILQQFLWTHMIPGGVAMDLFCKPVPAIKVLLYYYLAILQQSLWTLWICSASLFQPLKFYNITIWQFCNNFYGYYGFVPQA